MNDTQLNILTLIRLALCGKDGVISPVDDWRLVMNLASQQGVLGCVIDGIEHIPDELRPNPDLLIEYIGQVMYQEELYKHNWIIATKLADLWKKEGIRATILKGRAIAQYYPIPEHRYSCDLDVFLGKDHWEKGCKMLEAQGINLVYEIYKEAEFTLDGVYVECHRYITPLRGNNNLYGCELYLRKLLEGEQSLFEGTSLVCPPLMFTALLYIEHALFDVLHGCLTLKHVADWVVLRKQEGLNLVSLFAKCNEFGFDRFVRLIENLADVLEGKKGVEELPEQDKNVLYDLLKIKQIKKKGNLRKTWFARRVLTMQEIIDNRKMYKHYGYCSMPVFLWNALYTHFIKKEIII